MTCVSVCAAASNSPDKPSGIIFIKWWMPQDFMQMVSGACKRWHLENALIIGF